MEKKFLVFYGKEYSYEKLIEDLYLLRNYSPYLYIKGNNPYQIFLSIIHSLIYDYPIEVIDGDLSEKELEEMEIDTKSLFILKEVKNQHKVNDFQTLLNDISENKNWTLTLYTSGTTGRPKRVSHNLETLTRNVKVHDKFKENIWAFAYNPTHFAGLQVFFQALCNQNTIIYTFDGQEKNLPDLIEKHKITNISATSTFFRSVLPSLKGKVYPSMKRITFGGEKYDSSLEKPLQAIFPHAKIRNIYASTEAGSLFVANGEVFEVPVSISKLVKVNDNNELLIHHSLLGKSETYTLENGWFKTGDLVEQVDPNHFKFISRLTDLINVGGYKVNPIEVENILIKVPGVIDLLVKAKANRVTGQILVAEVIKDPETDEMELKKSIKQFAGKYLQKWKIPRIINFVDEIPKTRTGKKVRK